MYSLYETDEEKFASDVCKCGCGGKHHKTLVPDRKDIDPLIKIFDIFQFQNEAGRKSLFLITDRKYDQLAGESWHGYVDGYSVESYYRKDINIFQTNDFTFSLDNPAYSPFKNRAWLKVYDDGLILFHKDNFQTSIVEKVGFLTEDEIKTFKDIRQTCCYYEYRNEIRETPNNMCVGSVYLCKDESALHVFIRREEEFFIFASIDGQRINTYNIQPKMMNRMIKNAIFSYVGYIKPEEWLRFNRYIYTIGGPLDKDLDFRSLVNFERNVV